VTSQSQESLFRQLQEVVQLANRNGYYDAADWLLRQIEGMPK
jgi:hypothetical protein